MNEQENTPSKFFRKINTVELLRQSIRRSLGEPQIRVEVNNEQIDDIIQDTIALFSEYAADGVEHIKLPVKLEPNVFSYKIDDSVKSVKNIYSLSSMSYSLGIPSGYGFSSFPISMFEIGNFSTIDMAQLTIFQSMLQTNQAYYASPVVWNFNENTKILTIESKQSDNILLLDLAISYTPKEVDDIYGHIWVKKYATAQTKLLWGQILGKYSGNVIGGASINYDRIISEAQSEIEYLKEELLNTYGEPLGVFVM